MLKFCQERLAAWDKNQHAKEKAALKLLTQTGFRERSTNVLLQLSAPEVESHLHQVCQHLSNYSKNQ